MKTDSKHSDRESMAATIKGLPLEEHLRIKRSQKTRDPADDFAAWHKRFRHELASEFGEMPDEDDESGIKDYIKNMKKQFRLRLK